MNSNQLEQLRTEGDHAGSVAHPSAPNLPLWMKLVLVVLLVCAGAIVESARLTSVSGDLWIHLRSGLWILQNHSIPRTGLFSQNATATWIDPHWLFQFALALLYKAVGVRAIPFAVMCIKATSAACVFYLARHRKAAFVPSFIVAALAVVILDRMQPLGLLSACLFALELSLIAKFREDYDLKRVWPLALLFILWANVDSGFIYGVLVLALFALATLVIALTSMQQDWSRVGKAFGLLGIGTASTLFNPYFASTWSAAWTELVSDTVIRRFAEMQPMAFRTPLDFIAMLFVMCTLTVVGVRGRRDLFQLSLIALTMMLGFRFPREYWLVTLSCVAVLADVLADGAAGRTEPTVFSHARTSAISAAVLVVVIAASLAIPRDLKTLAKKAQAPLPIAACDAIRSGQLQSPLFNSYAWGGFLAYYLPEYPAVIDSRVGLYGEEWNQRFFNIIEARTRMEQDPMASLANTFLLEKDSGIANAMLNVPQLAEQFRVSYQDDTSIVFVRK